jgi:hypothetical protein
VADKPRRAPRPPRATDLTEERRSAILAAYHEQPRQEGEPLRNVYGRLAAALNVTRKLVADVLQGEIGRHELTEAVRRAVAARYQEFVGKMERPPESRHRVLAEEFGLSRTQVNEALLAMHRSLPDPRSQDRAGLFRIEQAYWRHLRRGDEPLERIAEVIAAEHQLAPWIVARYLDLIHDDPAKLQSTPLPDAETQQRILAGYERFLAGDGPTAESLHAALAAETGATPRQVHRVLLEHRWAMRRLRQADRMTG